MVRISSTDHKYTKYSEDNAARKIENIVFSGICYVVDDLESGARLDSKMNSCKFYPRPEMLPMFSIDTDCIVYAHGLSFPDNLDSTGLQPVRTEGRTYMDRAWGASRFVSASAKIRG